MGRGGKDGEGIEVGLLRMRTKGSRLVSGMKES